MLQGKLVVGPTASGGKTILLSLLHHFTLIGFPVREDLFETE